MPATDTSLIGGLVEIGVPNALAVDVAARLAATDIGTGGTPVAAKVRDLQANYTDISGTPGNGTANTTSGKAAFAGAGTTVTVTNSLVTAASKVFVQLGGADATLTTVRVTPGSGSFVVTGNAAATGTTPFTFLVVN